MTRSDTGAAVSVSVALLLARLGSGVPAGAATVAVLPRLAVAADAVVPVTVKTTELPAPAGMVTVALRLLPEPLPLTEAPPVALAVHVTLVRAAGMVSATLFPLTLLGPALISALSLHDALPVL